MTKGISFYPEFEMSITVRKIPDDHVRPIGQIFDKALAEVGDYAKATRGEALAIETQMDVAQPELTLDQMQDQVMAQALKKANGVKRAAAKLAGCSERQMYRWIIKQGEKAIT